MSDQIPIRLKAWDIKRKKMLVPSELQFRTEGVFCYFQTLNSKEYADMGTYYRKRKLCNPAPGCGREQEVILRKGTGLNDKKGVEIYQGDIIEVRGFKAFVKYVKHRSGFLCITKNGEPQKSWPLYRCYKQSQIIGNIYENPNLIN
jgi:uncharacterized phage protein (TIGR01671 family)